VQKICDPLISNEKKQECTVSCQDFLAMAEDGS